MFVYFNLNLSNLNLPNLNLYILILYSLFLIIIYYFINSLKSLASNVPKTGLAFISTPDL